MHRGATLLFACALAIGFAAPASAASPWAQITQADLTAIHQSLSDNHPGPVDPQNPNYRIWFQDGFRQAEAMAAAAENFYDYKRAVLFYLNGFRDEHTHLNSNVDSVSFEWPGFLPGVAADGKNRVAVSDEKDVAPGDEIVSCDGTPIDVLFEKNVAPYYWNRDIPQDRNVNMPRTLIIDSGDVKARVSSCELRGKIGVRKVALQWRYVPRAKGLDLRAQADGRTTPELGLRQIDGIWFLSLPGFYYQSGTDVQRFKQVLNDVAAHAKELQNAPRIVIDVRGNKGGISDWGLTAAGYLWGDDVVQAVNASLPGDVDWRASKSNFEHVDDFLKHARENGLPDSSIADLSKIRDLLSEGIAKGAPLVRQISPVTPLGTMPPSRFKGTVYLLTDDMCTSACLDFADVVLRLPNVVQVGMPTHADAMYIDLNSAPLPSGLGSFWYSMKVYRTRVRGNNEWYTPKYRWPGGLMTDDAVAKWIATLPLAKH